MWSPDDEQGYETDKVRWDLVPYMRGKCLDIGCGPTKAFPHFITIDNCKDTELFGIPIKPDLKLDVTDLSILASGEYDLVFSSHTLEHIKDYKKALREWWRLVKQGGYMALYLPHKDFYPRCQGREEFRDWLEEHKDEQGSLGEAVGRFIADRRKDAKTIGERYGGTPFANKDHVHDFGPDDILQAMKSLGGGFDLIECQERDQGSEYSFFMVFKKCNGVKESWKNPKPEKTCAIVRYGAIGDNIQAASILPWLKKEGYHVTFYCQEGNGYEAIKHDPHIDRFIIQGRDAVPAHVLTQFWAHEKKKYTKWVNFCEAVEGTLLACPDRAPFEWPNELRALHMDRNYLEFMHSLAGVPPPYLPRFYSTKQEQEWARNTAKSFGKRNVLWSLAGSSGHKMWPHIDAVIAGIMLVYRDVDVVLVGDEACQILEYGWQNEKRVHRRSGVWTIRESMAFAEVADLVIGTETGLLNAVGCMDTPKIVNLSHSSEEMLTKHWKNAIALSQPKGVGCNKQPCRQLHGAGTFEQWIDCPQHEETGASLCQFHISPEMMMDAVRRVLDGN